MKATGIVRRIDDQVIIGARSESLENTGVSLILSNFTSKVKASCMTAVSCNRARRKEDAALKLNTQRVSPGIALRIAEQYRGLFFCRNGGK